MSKRVDGRVREKLGQPIPGVTAHARQQQIERWGSVWSREAWLRVVQQIVERSAVLVRAYPVRKADSEPSELWLVQSPDGPARVVWRPNAALVVTVLGSAAEYNSAQYGRQVLGRQRFPAREGAHNTHRGSRARAEAEWRRAVKQDDEA